MSIDGADHQVNEKGVVGRNGFTKSSAKATLRLQTQTLDKCMLITLGHYFFLYIFQYNLKHNLSEQCINQLTRETKNYQKRNSHIPFVCLHRRHIYISKAAK